MKEEARFQIRGTVKSSANRSTGKWIIQELSITVTPPNGEESAPMPVDCFGDELAAVARSLRLGQQALVLGRLHCRLNKNGYPDLRLRADALMVEPDTERAYGAAAPGHGIDHRPLTIDQQEASRPAGGGHGRANANGFTPAQVHENLAEEDIPF